APRLQRGAGAQRARGVSHPVPLRAEAHRGCGQAARLGRDAAGGTRARGIHRDLHPQPGAMSERGQPLRVGIVAGESSGDQLGAALIAALRARVPEVRCFGMAGPKMAAAGCEVWASSDELSTMGLFEVLQHLPRLLRLRSQLAARFQHERPDVFVGIDVPDFNLGLAKRLKASGLKTVQYVSPQVWAWRRGRVRTIGRSCDLVLCLLPFETDFYARHGVRAEFVGHPLA